MHFIVLLSTVICYTISLKYGSFVNSNTLRRLCTQLIKGKMVKCFICGINIAITIYVNENVFNKSNVFPIYLVVYN